MSKTATAPINILFTHYGDDWIRGSERCLLDLLQHIDKTQFNPVLWCNQSLMADAAKAQGIKVYCSAFPLLLGWQAPRFNIAGFWGLIRQAKKIIKEQNISLIHANSAAPCQWLIFASQSANVPLICHMHSIYQLRDRLTLGLYQTDLVVGVSQYVVDPLLRDKKPRHEVSVIANGIDSQRLLAQQVTDLRSELNINNGDFVIATLGSLIHRKGVDLLIEAAAKLRQKEDIIHLLVLGDGPEHDNLQAQIKALNMQQHVTLLGECKHAVGVLRGTADLFVSAAREEAFGLVFAEASLAGLAIVAPKTGGIPDVVIDHKTGLLVAEQDVDALVQAIEELYHSPNTCEEMAKAGQQHVLEHFTIEKNCQTFQTLYLQCLKNKHFKKSLPRFLGSFIHCFWLVMVNRILKRANK